MFDKGLPVIIYCKLAANAHEILNNQHLVNLWIIVDMSPVFLNICT